MLHSARVAGRNPQPGWCASPQQRKQAKAEGRCRKQRSEAEAADEMVRTALSPLGPESGLSPYRPQSATTGNHSTAGQRAHSEAEGTRSTSHTRARVVAHKMQALDACSLQGAQRIGQPSASAGSWGHGGRYSQCRQRAGQHLLSANTEEKVVLGHLSLAHGLLHLSSGPRRETEPGRSQRADAGEKGPRTEFWSKFCDTVIARRSTST